MRGTVLHGARDVRFEDRAEPTIVSPTDAIISLSATCICGSDLWPYRGIQAIPGPVSMGHEYCGIVEDVGREVASLRRGQFVIGSFFASDNTCPHCRHGYQTSCQHAEPVVGAQAARMRVPLADGTLVATRDVPTADTVPSMLALSDVMGTGWSAAEAANVTPGATVVVVGHAADRRRRRRFGARVRRHAGVDDAGDQVHPPGWVRGLRRRAARRFARRPGTVLLSHVDLFTVGTIRNLRGVAVSPDEVLKRPR